MYQRIKQFIIFGAIVLVLIFPFFVFAQSNATLNKLNEVGNNSGYSTDSVNEYSAAGMVGNIISIFLSILGIIFIVLILYAGYHWMTAAGEEGKVEKAQDTIKRAIIGLIITVSAYAIWGFISGKLLGN